MNTNNPKNLIIEAINKKYPTVSREVVVGMTEKIGLNDLICFAQEIDIDTDAVLTQGVKQS